MIIERVYEFNVEPNDVADFFRSEYYEFIAKNDNEDTWDFCAYMLENFGFDYVRDQMDLSPEEIIDRIF